MCKHFNLPEPDVDLQLVETENERKRRMDNELKQAVEMKENCNVDQLYWID